MNYIKTTRRNKITRGIKVTGPIKLFSDIKTAAKVFLLVACLNTMPSLATPQQKLQEIDPMVETIMRAYQVPGVAIGVVKKGKVIYAKGYGLADIESGLNTDQNTLFKIASNSKAFTATALAILVDQKKLSWDDKVIDYLADFKMYDPWVTKEFNIRDLLTHRSGLGLGAGDLMLWPETTRFTRKDVVHNLRYLKPVSSFRDAYAYDNLMYIVAGELVAKISGMSWEQFIEKNIFKPLSMTGCIAGGVNLNKNKNLAAPHAIVNGKLELLAANRQSNHSSLMAAAGGVKCSVSALLKWVDFYLQAKPCKLLSAKQKRILQTPVTPLPISSRMKALNHTRYRAYALGWRISNFNAYHMVSHTGSLAGFMSRIIMLPEQQLGIVILTNQQSSEARRALGYALLNSLTHNNKPQKDTDWFAQYKSMIDALKNTQSKLAKNAQTLRVQPAKEITIADSKVNHSRLGDYNDPWFGQVTLKRAAGDIIFTSSMSPRMRGKVYYFAKNKWWVKWDDPSFEADAWMVFSDRKTNQKPQFRMKAISAKTDFSFDFDDLFFTLN